MKPAPPIYYILSIKQLIKFIIIIILKSIYIIIIIPVTKIFLGV